MQEHETMPPHTLFTVPALAGQHRLLLFTYLFSTFTDTIRKPMKIGCADGVCSHLNHVLTASSASDSACTEQLLPPPLYTFFFLSATAYMVYIVTKFGGCFFSLYSSYLK